MALIRIDAMREIGLMDAHPEWIASIDCRIRANGQIRVWVWTEQSTEYTQLDSPLVGIVAPGIFS